MENSHFCPPDLCGECPSFTSCLGFLPVNETCTLFFKCTLLVLTATEFIFNLKHYILLLCLQLFKKYPHLADHPGSLFTNDTNNSRFILIIGWAITHSIPSFRTCCIDVHGHLPITRTPIKPLTRPVWRVRTSHRLRKTRSSVCRSLTSSPSLARKVLYNLNLILFNWQITLMNYSDDLSL